MKQWGDSAGSQQLVPAPRQTRVVPQNVRESPTSSVDQPVAPTPPARPLTVRTGRQLSADFLMLAGQRQVSFRQGPLTPHHRIWPAGAALCLLEPFGHDLIHTFNTIPAASTKPWIVTFEDYLPRTPEDRPHPALERLLTRRLLSPGCRAILAMSEYALRQLRAQHAADPHLEELLAKTEVVHPAAPTRAARPHDLRAPDAPITLLCVGSDWVRKGFPAVLSAHALLRSRGVPVETTVVSSLRVPDGDYIGPADRERVASYRRLLDQPGVRHLPGAANQDVLALMDAADYLVLPTLHDTFGYVMIEAMAGGTPVIGTATCAVPEVVGPDMTELLVPIVNDDMVGKWEWVYRPQDDAYTAALDAQLTRSATHIADVVEQLAADRQRVQRHSELALDRSRRLFSHEALRSRLEPLYAQAVQRPSRRRMGRGAPPAPGSFPHPAPRSRLD